MTRVFLSVALWVAMLMPGLAGPVPYALDLRASKVVFFYAMNGQEGRGMFPVTQATTLVDLQDVRRSTLDVTIGTRFVQAGDPLVTLGLRANDMLATGTYPTARFVSTRVVAHGNGARITGNLTLRGVTRPVTLDAVFQRRADAPADNSELILRVSGTVSRKAFGVSGYPDLVDDPITLRFQVHLLRE